MPKYSAMRTRQDSQELEELQPPGAQGNGHSQSTQVDSKEQSIQNASWPDFWPWFDTESDEKEGEDTWANRTDPLITRHRPNSAEAAIIEQEDIRRALAEGVPTNQLPVHTARQRKSPLRNIFIALAIFAVVALAIDGVLLGAVSDRSQHAAATHSGLSAPSLTLLPNIISAPDNKPQMVQVQLLNFPQKAQVVLTHDIQESVQTASGALLIAIEDGGSARVTIIVTPGTPGWGPGSHLVVAEDEKTHYTASATLLITGQGPSQPAHLDISSTTLDFGTDYEGANTIKQLLLSNSSLSGSITWSASSNQPWLLVTPSSGMFNQSQTIDVAVQRFGNFTPGTIYKGTLTFYSNVGSPIPIKVTMSVKPVPSNTAVLAPTPAVLSFTTVDGSPAPQAQTLVINNPGSQPLNWSLTANSSITTSAQIVLSHQVGTTGNWLMTNPTSGSIPAHSNAPVKVWVQSASLLPGAYSGSLVLTAPQAIDSPQMVSVSLTIQPHCGLVTTPGFLSFTVVQGKASTGSQAIGLNATSSCTGTPTWSAQISTPGWLGVTPSSGQLKGTTSEFLAVNVNTTGLAARTYIGSLVFTMQQSTQTVLVQLVVQPPPSPSEPVVGASPLNLNFSNTQGQPNPNGQVVTITNNGGSTLYWKASPAEFVCSWLGVSPTGGSVPPGQAGAVTIKVNTSCLSPGTYAGQVTLEGMDSQGKTISGSPQTISVNLVVQPACTLTQPSSSSLSFSGVQEGPNPAPQNVLITGTGNCAWPLLVSTSVSAGASWLSSSAPPPVNGNGQSTSVAIGPNSGYKSLPQGTYTGQVSITATDSAGILAQGSPQTVSVTLAVLPPCSFATSTPASLTFTVTQLALAAQNNVTITETGTCSRPISYTASSNAAWLSAAQQAADSGNGGTLAVSVSGAGLTPGTHTGQITVSAVDSNNVALSDSLTIKVTLIVEATASGSVLACNGPAPTCTTSAPLPGATITVLSGSTTVLTATADSSGNFVLAGLPIGAYTVNVSGTDSSNTHYSTTGIPLSVTGNLTGVTFDVFPG